MSKHPLKFENDHYIGRTEVLFSDSPNLDAFSRVRVSGATNLLDAQHHYGQQHYLFQEIVTLGGSVVNDFDNSSLDLTVTSTIGSKVVNRSRRQYYQAGHSQMIAETFNFGPFVAGIRKAVGYIDDDDGVALERTATGDVRIFLRTSTSGSPVEADSILQEDWNIDKLDGDGRSGITADWTTTQILIMDLQWLGVGRVRFALDIDGVIYPVHEILNANEKNTVYMQTANLPACYEIENMSAGVGDTFQQICTAVFSEGGEQTIALSKAISNETVGISCLDGVTTHIMSIRPAALFLGRANKGTAVPQAIQILVTGNNAAHYEVYEDAEIAGTWIPHPDSDSMMEYLPGGTLVTVGRHRDEGYVPGGGKGGSLGAGSRITTDYIMQIDPANIPDTFDIVAAGDGGTAVVKASIQWAERY